MHKDYVKECDVEAVKAACEAWHEQQRWTKTLLAKGAEIVRWREGGRKQCEDPIEEVDRMVDRHTTVEMLLLLARGGFGTAKQQVQAAMVMARIREAGREAQVPKADLSERVAALMRGTSGPSRPMPAKAPPASTRNRWIMLESTRI
jgi:hypothetical protein